MRTIVVKRFLLNEKQKIINMRTVITSLKYDYYYNGCEKLIKAGSELIEVRGTAFNSV